MNQNSTSLSLKALKAQRTRQRSSLSRLAKHLDGLNTENIDIKELEGRLSQLEQIPKQYDAIQAQIEDLTELECDEDERMDFEKTYFLILGRISKLISEHSQTHSKIKQDTHTPSTDEKSFSLPTIPIPEFSGAYEDWTDFHDTFSSLVDSNPNISNVKKFHYLKSALKGTATEAVRSLSVSNENYSIAWNMLKKRYDNKRLIVENHIGSIFELPLMQKGNPVPLRSILDGIIRHTSSLTTLEVPVKYWDAILVYIIKRKMDASTNQEWEAHLPDTTSIPTLETLTDFLTKKCQALESHSRNSSTPSVTPPKRMSHLATISNCKICSKNHMVFQCEVFRKMSPEQRINQAKSKQLCLNCLKSNHTAQRCTSQSCKICHKKHNTLLHIHSSNNETKPAAPVPQAIPESLPSTVSNHAMQQSRFTTALLSTAVIEVYDIKSKPQSCRVLLDPGSQCNFISKALMDQLGIKGEPFHIPVKGISQSNTHIKTIVDTKIKSKYNNFQSTIKCLVLDKITENLPQVSIDLSTFDIPKNIKLADPEFYKSRPIDMLLGVDLFWKLVCVGQIKSNSKHPCLQKTHFGWIVAGSPVPNNQSPESVTCNLSIASSLDDKIASFWELENIPAVSTYTPDEQTCENHFMNTHTRDESGRFIVKLPFKSSPGNLGDTHNMALKRFHNLEGKLNKNDDLKIQYINFLDEYLKLGHMTRIVSPESPIDSSHSSYYLPHHAVLKPSSTTTKLRVVFDGSAKSSTGISLNDQLLVGPTIQDDLFSIILRFRTYKIVLTADIAKMYRQVLVHENDRKFQRILWREDQKMPVQTFELSTVTYGTASASYLATRCLHQLAQEHKSEFPIGSKVTSHDFYVDDLITGSDTVEEAIDIINQSTSLLSKGGFELRKWCSNNPNVFKNANISTSSESIHPLDKENIKTLGLVWNSHKDLLSYHFPEQRVPAKITKRSILSFIASLFDPLGLIGPTVLIGKVIMQKLWQANVNWDESVPLDIHLQFNSYVQDIQCLPEINVSRIVVSSKNCDQIELHGFCDASETAYGACIYIKGIDSLGNVNCNLLCAKSRVAPVKSVSIPRLELCGALLLAQLAAKVIGKLNINFTGVWYWTDSTIVLAWLKSPNKQWKTFVANRVNLINSSTEASAWNHVPSEENPADIISRGMLASDLRTSKLWWHGPEFLQTPKNNHVPYELPNNMIIPEQRKSTVALSSTCGEPNPIFTRYSSLSKLINVIAYCIRFTKNTVASVRCSNEERRSGPLSLAEIKSARIQLIKLVQRETFSVEISQLAL